MYSYLIYFASGDVYEALMLLMSGIALCVGLSPPRALLVLTHAHLNAHFCSHSFITHIKSTYPCLLFVLPP